MRGEPFADRCRPQLQALERLAGLLEPCRKSVGCMSLGSRNSALASVSVAWHSWTRAERGANSASSGVHRRKSEGDASNTLNVEQNDSWRCDGSDLGLGTWDLGLRVFARFVIHQWWSCWIGF